MNKFERGISANGNESLKSRASIISQQAANAQEALVRDLQNKKLNLELDVMKMTDLAPDSTVSTKPQGAAVDNPQQWVKDLHEKKKAIKLLEIEIGIAVQTQAEWFIDEQAKKEATA